MIGDLVTAIGEFCIVLGAVILLRTSWELWRS